MGSNPGPVPHEAEVTPEGTQEMPQTGGCRESRTPRADSCWAAAPSGGAGAALQETDPGTTIYNLIRSGSETIPTGKRDGIKNR